MSWKKIGAASGFILAATVATASLQWVIMAAIARREGPTALGLYTLGLSFSVPLGYVSWLSIRQRYLTLAAGQENIPDFLFLRTLLPVIVFAISLYFIGSFTQMPGLTTLCFSLFLLKYIEGFYDLIYGRMQKEDESRLVAVTSIFRSVLSAGVFLLTYWISNNLVISMLVTAVQQVAILYKVRKYLIPPLPIEAEALTVKLNRRFWLAVDLFPMSLSLLLMSVTSNAPRFLLGGIVGAKELGFYAAVSTLTGIGSIGASAIAQSILPSLGEAVAADNRAAFWRRLIWPMVFVESGSLIGAGAAAFIGSSVMTAIYGHAFQNLGYLVVIGAISAGPGYMAQVASNGIYAVHLRAALFWSQAATMVFAVVSIFLFAHFFGLVGSFIALGLQGLFQTIVSIFLLTRHWSAKAAADPFTSFRGRSYSV